MKMMLLSVLALLSVLGGSQQREMCPERLGVNVWDNARFQGDWYVLARPNVAVAPHTDAVCWKNTWQSDDKFMNLTNNSLNKDGTKNTFSMKGRFSDLERGAVLESVFKLGPSDPEYHGMVTQSIIATDYETFAVHYACAEVYNNNNDTYSRMVAAEVWSRTTTMSTELLETLKCVVGGQIDMKTSEITNVNQSGCT